MRFALAAVALVALAAGCPPIETKIPSSSAIDVPGQGILAGSPLLPAQAFPSDLIGQALAQSINQSFDTSGYDKARVSSLKLTGLKLTVTDPNQGGAQVRDLSFLQKLTVFLGPSGGDPINVAESGDGDFDGKPIVYDMPLSDAELADAFKSSDALTMSADVVPGDPPRFDTNVVIDSEVTVDISIL